MTLNLNQLRIFQAVLEYGSLTQAAAALRVSQPAVSKQLAELENAVGVPLVDRLPRGVRPTAAGEVLAPHIKRIFLAETAAEDALRDFLGLQTGRLAVGASTTIGNYLVPQVFGDLSKDFPNVALDLAIGNTKTIQEQLLEGSLDVGLTEGLVASDALEIEVFTHDQIVLIIAPGHPVARQTALSMSDLGDLPLVVRELGSGTRDVVEAALKEQGIELKPAMSLGSTEAVKSAVSMGLGAAFVSRLTVELELTSGRLCELRLEGWSLRRALHLLTLKGKHPSPVAQEFVSRLQARFQ